jgi:hypothetical protein
MSGMVRSGIWCCWRRQHDASDPRRNDTALHAGVRLETDRSIARADPLPAKWHKGVGRSLEAWIGPIGTVERVT